MRNAVNLIVVGISGSLVGEALRTHHEYLAAGTAFVLGVYCSVFFIDGAKSLVIRAQRQLLEQQSKALISVVRETDQLLGDVIAVIERIGGSSPAVEEMRVLLRDARAKVAGAADKMKTIEVSL